MQPRMPTRIPAMSDSDGSPQQDNRHHRRSRSRSPVSPGCAGENLAEREEQQLAEAAVAVGPPAEEPQAATTDPEPPAQEPVPAGVAAPATQAAAPAAPPPGEWGGGCARGCDRGPDRSRRGPRHAAGAGDGPHAGPAQGTAAAAAEGREGAKYRAHTKPIHTHTSPPKWYPPKAAFPEGRPRLVRPPAPKRMPPGVTLPQLERQRDAQRVVQEGGDGEQTGRGAGHGNAGRGAEGNRGSAKGRTQGTGQSARGDERGQGHGQGTTASSSGGGRAHGAGQGAGKGTGRTRAPAEKARVRVTEVGTRDTGQASEGRERARTRGRG